MSNLTRKSFLTSLGVAIAATTLRAMTKPIFRDIDPDFHYTDDDIHYSFQGKDYIQALKNLHPLPLQTLSLHNNWSIRLLEIETGRTININHSWLREFYTRHP